MKQEESYQKEVKDVISELDKITNKIINKNEILDKLMGSYLGFDNSSDFADHVARNEKIIREKLNHLTNDVSIELLIDDFIVVSKTSDLTTVRDVRSYAISAPIFNSFKEQTYSSSLSADDKRIIGYINSSRENDDSIIAANEILFKEGWHNVCEEADLATRDVCIALSHMLREKEINYRLLSNAADLMKNPESASSTEEKNNVIYHIAKYIGEMMETSTHYREIMLLYPEERDAIKKSNPLNWMPLYSSLSAKYGDRHSVPGSKDKEREEKFHIENLCGIYEELTGKDSKHIKNLLSGKTIFDSLKEILSKKGKNDT